MQVVYLTPRSTFPESIPSNTLFGAICRSMNELGYDTDAFIDSYSKSPPVLISSSMPYTRTNAGIMHLFPMPIFPSVQSDKVDYEMMKNLKKIRFVDESIFTRICDGSLKIETLVQTWDRFTYHRDTGVLSVNKKNKVKVREQYDLPHNQINRRSTASENFFYTTGSHYDNGGLFFLIQFQNRHWEEAVLASLRLLEDRGIGAKVSSGQGQFTLSMGEIDIPDNRDAPFLTTLSRFIPGSMREFGSDIWYDLIPIRGRSTDGVMKRKVLMLSEGTVFRNSGQETIGKIVTVRDSPRVVEFGLAFPVGIRGVS